ncbi:hypothetical protein LEM8419_00408 [Neolewinella maritima]|uniref:TonB-dependent receptor n=1 Tax=Neolewinella maritima TaxID=1383882 RepID=A0ABM9AXT8_9BACT|nr:TonB-dependent receptor [Neolewinella maritima]CAH0999112.1 hypothetical protein LEM8419_00408 [Neolewinella maritima]
MKLLFFLAALATTSLVYAQQDITVELIDYQTNAAAPAELAVTLTNTGQGIVRNGTTDAQGRIIFRALPALAGYRITVPESDDYLDGESEPIDLRANQSRRVQLLLFSRQTVDLDVISVAATSSARINRQDAEVAFELSQEELEALPVEGRDITRALYRLPNVSQATGFYPEAPNVSINGANPGSTSYLIDGLDNNERFLGGQKFAIPSGFVRNLTVLTNNYSAEYGLTNNGVVNVTTRSGSNTLSGEVFTLFRPSNGDLGDDDYTQRDLSGNPVRDGFQRYQGGFALGGALKKDKTFFYVDAEHTTDLKDNTLSSPQLGVNETVQGTNNFTFLSGKVDQVWNDRFRSSLRANVGVVGIERQGGGLEGGSTFPSAGNKQDRNSVLIANTNTYLGDNWSAQTNVQYARFRWNYANPASDAGTPQVTILDPSEQTIAVIGYPGFVFDQIENTLQLQQKFSFYLDRHTLKTGFNVISGDHQLFGGGVPNGAYRVKLTEGQLSSLRERGLGSSLSPTDLPADVEVLGYNVELRPSSFGARQNIYSLYVEDQFAASEKLNLTLGLRYDYDNLSKGGAAKGDYNNISPRFNFNYKLGNLSALRGGYGVFYDKVLYAIYSDALQQNTTNPGYQTQLRELIRQGILPADTDIDRITFDGNLRATDNSATYLNGPTAASLQGQRTNLFSGERRILNPDGYDNPYTHQFTLGYQYQIDTRTLFYLDLVHNRAEKLYRLRNLNAAAEYPISGPDNVIVRTPAEADATRPIPIDGASGTALIQGEQVAGVARNILISETAGKSRYYAASFVLQQAAGDNNISWRLNYTLSSNKNDTEGINFRAMDANNFANEYGPSINDRLHIINAIGTYRAPFGLNVTLASLVQSGQPVNRIPDATLYGTADLNGDGTGFAENYTGNSDRFPGEGRNNDRLPWSYNFDLALEYRLPVAANHIGLTLDVFNLLDTRNLSGYSNNATQSNQIQVGAAGSGIVQRNADAPRQVQLGLRYLF